MKPYTRRIEVDVHDVDVNRVARASALMRYIQSTAQYQLTEGGKSYDVLRKSNRAFILSRIKMEFSESIREYDPLTVTTFPCDSRGYSFLRCYTIERFGKMIGKAVSVWALIDTENHSLVRVNDFDLGLETYSPLDINLGRTVMPRDLTEVGHFTVAYGVTDRNRHMNNTAYPDMYSNFLPLENRRIKSITINYQNEAPERDKLTVLRGYSDGIFYFRTIRNDGKVNSEAEIELEDIN